MTACCKFDETATAQRPTSSQSSMPTNSKKAPRCVATPLTCRERHTPPAAAPTVEKGAFTTAVVPPEPPDKLVARTAPRALRQRDLRITTHRPTIPANKLAAVGQDASIVTIRFLPRGKGGTLRPDSRSPQDHFSGLVRPHLAGLYRLACRFTGRQHEAEDLLQELLTRLYARAERLERVENLRPWLARALYNLYVDELRHLTRSPLGHLNPPSPGEAEPTDLAARAAPDTDLTLSTEMERVGQHLAELVDQLPQDQREVVILHDVEGYELQESAEILGVALGTVKSRLHRAHERLRHWLRQRNLSPATVVLSNEDADGAACPPLARVSDNEL